MANPYLRFSAKPNPYSRFSSPIEGDWEEFGVVLRNRRTGETKPKPIPGGVTDVPDTPSWEEPFRRALPDEVGEQIIGSLAPVQVVQGARHWLSKAGIGEGATSILPGRDRALEDLRAASVAPKRTELALGLTAGLANPLNYLALGGAAKSLPSRVSRETFGAERRVNPSLRGAVDLALPKVREAEDLDSLMRMAEETGDEAMIRAVERVSIERTTAPYNRPYLDSLPPVTPEGDAIKDAVEDIERTGFFGKWLKSRGAQNPQDFERIRLAENLATEKVKSAENIVSDIDSALRKNLGLFSKSKKEELLALSDKALRGEVPTEILPPYLRGPVSQARTLIDSLSTEMLGTGLVDDEMASVFRSNLGSYMNRRFQAFDDAHWLKKVEGTKTWKAAVDRIAADNPEIGDPEAWVESFVRRDPDAAAVFGGKSPLGRKDIGIFKKRSEMPQELLDVLGEYKDPRLNIVNSVQKMAHSLETHKALTEIRDLGQNVRFFDQPRGAATVPIAGDPKFNPLAGKFATPEMAEAMSSAQKQAHTTIGDAGRFLNGAVKLGATVGNFPAGAGRNFGSNHLMSLFNAQVQNPLSPTVWRLTAMQFGARGAKNPAKLQELREMQSFLARVDALGEGANMADIDQYADWAKGFWYEQFGGNSAGRGIGTAVSKAWKVPEAAWRGGDTFHRITRALAEKKLYEGAMKGAPAEVIEAKVRQVLAETLVTGSRAPKAIQGLRKIPLVAPFPTFSAEVARTAKGTLKIALSDMMSGEPGLVKAGIRRALGAITTSAAVGALSYGKLTEMSSEEQEAVREYVPDYNKQSILHPWKKANGDIAYIDLDFTVPYSFMAQGLKYALAGDFGAAVRVAGEPFSGYEILPETVAEAAFNKTSYGREIRHPSDPATEQIGDTAKYLGYELQPGSGRLAYRNWMAQQGKSEASGRTYGRATEALGALGIRIESFSPKKRVESYGKHLQSMRADVKKSYKENLSIDTPPQERKERQKKANENWRELFDEARVKVDAARRLGVTDRQIRESLKGRVNQETIEGLLRGRFVPLSFDEDEITIR